MDDFNISSLHESKNEWSSRLVTVLTPLFIEGYRSILEESVKMCKANDEMSKYLMTFQNLISRIPKWNQTIVENECIRIIERSGCVYLEDLITCVHVIQLKILTSVRVGQHHGTPHSVLLQGNEHHPQSHAPAGVPVPKHHPVVLLLL